MFRQLNIALCFCLLLSACDNKMKEDHLPVVKVSRFDVVWDTPSKNEEGSMPLGNGDIGANVWMTPDGKLHFYLAKTDAVNENAQLLKLGKVEVDVIPNPFIQNGSFEQALILEDGSIRIQQKDEQSNFFGEVLVWIDANNPTAQVIVNTAEDTKLKVEFVTWRDTLRKMDAIERHAAYGVSQKEGPIYVYPDTVLYLQMN